MNEKYKAYQLKVKGIDKNMFETPFYQKNKCEKIHFSGIISEQKIETSDSTDYVTLAPKFKPHSDGTHITIDGILTFEDIKESTGEIADILSVITPEKKVYSCQSSTFKRSLRDISNIMKGKPFTIVKTSGKTKAGRDFINCELDVESLILTACTLIGTRFFRQEGDYSWQKEKRKYQLIREIETE